MKKWMLTAALTLLTVTAVMATAPEGWYTDYQDAKKIAVEKHLPMYLLFTGSDWCPWCIKLHDEVLTQQAFIDYAKDKVVLVYLDFPKKAKLNQAEVMQNRILSKSYNIEGFPTIVITDADGKEQGRLGATSLEDHLRDLKAMIKN